MWAVREHIQRWGQEDRRLDQMKMFQLTAAPGGSQTICCERFSFRASKFCWRYLTPGMVLGIASQSGGLTTIDGN